MPPRKPPKSQAKWVWDRKAKRWRHGGRFAPPPAARQLRADRAGNLIDDAGKRVPQAAPLKVVKRKPKSKAVKAKSKPIPVKVKSKPKAKVSKRTLESLGQIVKEASAPKPVRPKPVRSRVQRVSSGGDLSSGTGNKRVTSHLGRKGVHDLGGQFAGVSESAASRTPLEAHDLTVFNHGVLFITKSRLPKELVEGIANSAPKGAKLKLYEGKETALSIDFGGKPKTGNRPGASFERNQDWVSKVWDELLEWAPDLEYELWFEIDEEGY